MNASKILACALFMSVALSASVHGEVSKNGTYLSEEIQEICKEVGNEYGINQYILMAIIERESSGNVEANDYKTGTCKGLMQVSEKWHKDRMRELGVVDLYDPYSNILVGTDFLHELSQQNASLSYCLMKYNGDSRADYFHETDQLSDYSVWIIERSLELEEFYEGKVTRSYDEF